MLGRLFRRKIRDTIGLFNGHFVEAKAFYALEFDTICCVTFIGEIDTSKAFAHINESLSADMGHVYQHAYYDHAERKMFFNNTLFVLSHERMIELGNNWCQVLHTPAQHGWANSLIEQLAVFKIKNVEPVIGFTMQAATN